ncbi:MAG: hypoxanthine phosphoribosyltransferase [Selenomonadaceae bacterium]|nr:hypoxanthine phosphoribosyltransferase [Selenomonadaceae bacterium]
MMQEDMERVLFTEADIKAKVKELGKKITADYQDAKEAIFCVGILKGAVIFYTDLVRQIDLPVEFDFMIASSYGNSSLSSGNVKILKDLDYDIAGKHVIVIEDIIDTGHTMSYLRKILPARSPASVKICAFLSKPSRRQVDVAIDYCGFEVPDEFLVGYGLDYAGRYRNLPYVGVLKREIYVAPPLP